MLAPMNPVYRTTPDDTLLAVREACSRHPEAAYYGPEKLLALVHELRVSPQRPAISEVEAALEALRIEGQILA